MDSESRRRFEEYRKNEAGPVENTLLDEFADGELDRSEFLQLVRAAKTAGALRPQPR